MRVSGECWKTHQNLEQLGKNRCGNRKVNIRTQKQTDANN